MHHCDQNRHSRSRRKYLLFHPSLHNKRLDKYSPLRQHSMYDTCRSMFHPPAEECYRSNSPGASLHFLHPEASQD